MPTRTNTNFARLTDEVEFESLLRDICAFEWNDPHTQKFGRKGQKQYGVDVYGQPPHLKGRYCAVQCKLRTKDSQLSKDEIEAEVLEARRFPHQLETLIIATDAPRDTHTQIQVDKIGEQEQKNGGFRVVIWFWDDITERLAAYPRLIVRYYQEILSAITTASFSERLLDTPLQIETVYPIAPGNITPLEEALSFRGIRILHITNPASADPYLDRGGPDGILLEYSHFAANEDQIPDSAIYKFAAIALASSNRLDSSCPVIAILPSTATAPLHQAIVSLGGEPSRIQMLKSEDTLSSLADTVFRKVFEYGYMRRGAITTVDIAARTTDSKPDAVLLDMNWLTRLGIEHFPSKTEWETNLLPALMVVKQQILSQPERLRVQFDCRLPLPAAFALGYQFNIRVAKVGVWTRRIDASDFKEQFWLSNATTEPINYQPKWILHGNSNAKRAVVELTTNVDIHSQVSRFINKAKIQIDSWLQIELIENGQTTKNIHERQAVAYASQVAQIIRRLNEVGIEDIDLFARIPSSLAVLIGQRLLACGRIHLYWYTNQNSSYQYAFTLS